jgi:phosphoribosyl 1,2-cyclic phosphodiesterase
MNLRVLASGSRGNCYRLEAGGSPLLLECGITLREIREGLGYGLSQIEGCLLTHEHADHAVAAHDILRAGVDLYCSEGTAKALNLEGHRLRIVKAREPFRIGGWRVLPFDTIHDAEEPLGFLLQHGEEKVLFATDTAYLKYRFNGLTHILLEVNYDLETLKQNVEEGRTPREVKRRVLKSHMSLETAKGFFQANDLSRVQEIWLLHLSDNNSTADRFKREIQAITGKVVRTA